MAGSGDPNATTIALPYTIAPTLPAAPSRRSLPNGPCNYRDATVGQCGCDQFWDKLSADLHDEIAAPGPSSERSTWCVCGHHACFHLRASRAPSRRAPSIDIPRRPLHATCDGPGQLVSGAQCDAHPAIRRADENLSPKHQAIHPERILAEPTFSARFLQQTSQAFGSGRIAQSQDTPSQASTTGLPGIPSVCLLSRDQRPATNNEARQGANQTRQTLAGLGLSMMHLESTGQINCQQQSPTSTVPDDFNVAQAPQRPCSAPGGSTRANSIHNETNVNSPSRGILEHVYEFNRQIQLDVPGDTIPNTYNPEYVQSVTEVATPSAGNTPDLNAVDRAVQEGKDFIDQLARMTSNTQQQSDDAPDRPTYATVPTQLLLTNPPTAPQEQLQQILQSAPPQGFQKLVSYLAPLHNLLNSIPNVAKTMQELGSRLDTLENGSFNYVQPEDLNQTLEMYEGRLIDVEHRTGEHEKLLQAIDDRGSSTSFSRRRIGNVTASFGSNHSGESTTSSALILAAMDRQETEMELENIKERLEVLEAAAPPTSLSPWEVEVVLLPWGPELRGIWFSPEEPMHDAVNSTTQSSEEWTQARSSKAGKSLPFSEALGRDTDSSPYPRAHTPVKGPLLNPTGGGWSSQDISNWASGSTDDWLFPKACGSNNLVYKRLQSRGFVRNVTFRGASAKDIQETLSQAFCDVFDYLQYDDSDENPMITEYPGLRAPYIPLRKVLKETRLRFLTPAEMSSSALWSAQFLAAGVMMRVSGGKKRLYVTVREAYTQQIDRNEFVIMEQSWPELRQLPRYQPDQGSKMDGNEEHCQSHVPEADAKEACWQFVEAYDAPPASVHSSFGSAQSLQLSMRPADQQWRRSITPNSILKKRQLRLISPVSENPRRPSYYRDRTVSTSVVETLPPGSSKRRFNSSPAKQSFAPQHVSRTPSLSMVRPKRRRVASSSSPQPNQDAVVEPQVPVWAATPRRSREPPSPFFSSQPALQRSTSDATSRPSQRSIAVAGKSTPFAYATPHSGPVVGGPAFNAYNNGGDTEPDDDDNDAYDGDDGEQSWHGVTDGDNDSVSDSALDAGAGAQETGSFSGDDSGFGSDNSDAQSDEEAEVEAYAQRQQDEEDEDEEDVFDSLLSVIED